MITVYEVLTDYCQKNGLPKPNRNDATHAGAMIRTHFSRFWGPYQPAEVIAQAGFIISQEPGMPILVTGYPECFADEMRKRIGVYYALKEIKRDKATMVVLEEPVIKGPGTKDPLADKIKGPVGQRKRIPLKK